MHNFKDLKVWQKSIDLAVDIYKAMSLFPNDEKYGLVSQMKRCSVSIASNIVEGSGRGSDKEFNHFLNISQGSAFELETQLILAKELELCSEDEIQKSLNLTIEISQNISNFIKYLNTKLNTK